MLASSSASRVRRASSLPPPDDDDESDADEALADVFVTVTVESARRVPAMRWAAPSIARDVPIIV